MRLTVLLYAITKLLWQTVKFFFNLNIDLIWFSTNLTVKYFYDRKRNESVPGIYDLSQKKSICLQLQGLLYKEWVSGTAIY